MSHVYHQFSCYKHYADHPCGGGTLPGLATLTPGNWWPSLDSLLLIQWKYSFWSIMVRILISLSSFIRVYHGEVIVCKVDDELANSISSESCRSVCRVLYSKAAVSVFILCFSSPFKYISIDIAVISPFDDSSRSICVSLQSPTL